MRRGVFCVVFAVSTTILMFFSLRTPAQSIPPPARIDTGDLFVIAQIHYGGGGDWYEDKTSMPRLQQRIAKEFGVTAAKDRKIMKLTDDDIYSFPILFMTGHGNVLFKPEEVVALRRYLDRGGFLWVSDDYGIDESLRREMRKVIPETGFVEIPFDNPIYNVPYKFPNGLPKIHEHAGGAPHGYGLYLDERMVVFYDFNTDIGDGLESPGIHKDPPEKQEQAFKMAVNIIYYALSH